MFISNFYGFLLDEFGMLSLRAGFSATAELSCSLSGEKVGELWSTNNKVIDAHVDPPNWTFSEDYISAPRGRWPLKFLHALDTGHGNFKGERLKLGLKFHIMCAYNFATSGHNLTKLYQGMWLIAGVITWTLVLQGCPLQNFAG